MKIEDNDIRTSQRDLIRIAHRGLHALDQHAPASPALQALAPSGRQALQAFIDDYSTKQLLAASVVTRLNAVRRRIGRLRRELRGWLAAYEVEVEDFDPTPYRTGGNQYEQTLHALDGLMRLVADSQQGEHPMPYHAELQQALRGPVAEAWSDLREVQRAQVELQEHQARTRRTGAEASDKLVAMRSILRVLLGSRHRDYRSLRMPRRRGAASPEEPPLPQDVASEPPANDLTPGELEPETGDPTPSAPDPDAEAA